jgi:IclR family pca regulon transcriptional regulator
MVDQELEEGLRSLAVPVHDSKGEVVAAINVSVHASRWSLEAVRKQLLPRLLETAAAVERDSHAAATV